MLGRGRCWGVSMDSNPRSAGKSKEKGARAEKSTMEDNSGYGWLSWGRRVIILLRKSRRILFRFRRIIISHRHTRRVK